MTQQIRENIRVAAIFGPGTAIRPVWFDWGRRKYTVQEITCTWEERRGTALLLHFGVSDGATLFQLTYNAATQGWSLGAVEAG